MLFCPFCNRENEDWYSFCQYCGTRLELPVPDTGRRPSEGKGTDSDYTCEPNLPGRKDEISSSKIKAVPPSPIFAETAPLLSIPPLEINPLPPAPPTPARKIMREPTAPRTPVLKAAEACKKICDACGTEISGATAFCSHCGHACLPGGPVPYTPSTEAVVKPEPSVLKNQKKQSFYIVHFREGEMVDIGFPLKMGETVIGRYLGDILFPSDPMLSKRHLRLLQEASQILLEDLSSTNGTYLRIKRPTPLQDGDMILVGKEILRFDLPETGSADRGTDQGDSTVGQGCAESIEQPRLVKRLSRGQDGNEYILTEDCTVIGREDGDIVFRSDPILSNPHARIVRRNTFFLLEDMNSSKGTYLRLRTPVQVEAEDFFIIGDQLFQIRVKLL